MLVRVTGSQLDRVHRCEASAALPQVVDANDDDDDRKRGTVVHAFLDRVAKVGREIALAEVDEKHRDLCADVELAKIADLLTLSTEVAIAYNWKADTARLLTPVSHRAYEIDISCEVAGTFDVVGVRADRVFVGDYKGPHAWLPRPDQSYQLGLGAVALSRLYDKDAATVEHVRIRDDGKPLRIFATLDYFKLQETADRIAEVMSGVPTLRARIEAGLVPDVVEGPWCRYCPAKPHCPARTALIRAAMTEVEQPPYSVAVTPANARQVYETWLKAKDVMKQVEAGLYAYAKTTPIPLGLDDDGSMRLFGELRRPGSDKLDGAKTHQLLTELYGGEAANKAVTMEATKAAVGDVVREHMPKDAKITVETKKVIEALRARGGITNPETVSTREYTVSQDGAVKARQAKKAS